jgi:anti-sigma regulatory factor (Ser/Thr protein kinase)
MEKVVLHYDIDGKDFSSAGEASASVKKNLKKMGFPPEVVRKVSIAMYEAEINMVIHANGGTAEVEITPDKVSMVLEDKGPGIEDVDLAMQEGYSTATEEIRQLGFGAGMGLPNIKKYTDELEIVSKKGAGTTIKMSVYV